MGSKRMGPTRYTLSAGALRRTGFVALYRIVIGAIVNLKEKYVTQMICMSLADFGNCRGTPVTSIVYRLLFSKAAAEANEPNPTHWATSIHVASSPFFRM